ncbi:MAG: DUF2341 domain-containing protein [Patescibacteria group bacterium]|jgi:hypothetical protein
MIVLIWLQKHIYRTTKMVRTAPCFLYRSIGVCYVFSAHLLIVLGQAGFVLFLRPQTSFQKYNILNSTKTYTVSYIQYRTWVRNIKVGAVSLTSILTGIIVVTSILVTSALVSAMSVSVLCSGSSDSPTAIVESEYVGDVLTLTASGDGYCELNEPLTVSTLIISDGVVLTQVATDADGVTITANTLQIEGSGSIDVTGKGYAGGILDAGNGAGGGAYDNGVYYGGAGGGYGGAGGNGGALGGQTIIGGSTYGSADVPTYFGSGGGASGRDGTDLSQVAGGAGGGIVTLMITHTLFIDSTASIRANGEDALHTVGADSALQASAGSGSGGSIYITTNFLTGSGVIQAQGGSAMYSNSSELSGGGGGGGRVAYGFINITNWFGTITATAGTGDENGADGTILTKTLTIPSTPTFLSPLTNSYNASVNLMLTSAPYVANGAEHTSSSWLIATDLSATNVVWQAADSSSLESVTVNTTDGDFVGDYALNTELMSNTQYYAFVTHTNAVGNSVRSVAVQFTTVIVGTPTGVEYDFSTDTEYSVNHNIIEFNAGMVQLKDLGAGSYANIALSGWNVYLPIIIENQVASELSSFPVRIQLTYDADMQINFNDIRFLDSDGSTALDYWVQDVATSTSATIFVELPTLGSLASTTIYMYYGNATALTNSNIATTMTLGDDFSGATINEVWTEATRGDASIGAISSGQWTKSCVNSCPWSSTYDLQAGIFQEQPVGTWEMVTRLNSLIGDASKQPYAGLMLYENPLDGYNYIINNANGSYSARIDFTSQGNICSEWSSTSFPKYLRIVKTGDTTYTYHQSQNGTTWNRCGSYTTNDVMSYLGLMIGHRTTNAVTTTGAFDFVYVRDSVDTEPTYSFGSETASYDYTDVAVTLTEASSIATYDTLLSFTETRPVGNTGSVYYQISNNGSNWYYHNGTQWAIASNNATDKNIATEVSAYLPAFATEVGTGQFYFRAFLISNGSQPVTLDNINVRYNINPTMSPIAPQVLVEDTEQAVILDLNNYFIDEGDTLQYTAVDSFDSSLGSMIINANGTIDFNLTANAAASDVVQFRATDIAGAFINSNVINVSISAVNDPPIVSVGTATNTPNEDMLTVILTASATDVENDLLTYTWEEIADVTEQCNLSTFNEQNSVLSFMNAELNYSCTYEITVSDGIDSAAETVAVAIAADNDKPVFTVISDQAVDEGEKLIVSFLATDVDSSVITLHATDIDGTFAAAGLLIDNLFSDNAAGTGTYTWTPGNNDAGTYRVQVEATDGVSTTTSVFTIVVSDIEPEKTEEPEFTPIYHRQEIDHIKNNLQGTGQVIIYTDANQIHCTINAWSKGGAIGQLVRLAGQDYIAVVKNRFGSTIHLYDLNCGMINKKRLSIRLHPRKMVIGNFIGQTNSQEMAVSSKYGVKVYIKILRYNLAKNEWYLLRQKSFRHITDNYFLAKNKTGDILIKNHRNKILRKWKIKKHLAKDTVIII